LDIAAVFVVEVPVRIQALGQMRLGRDASEREKTTSHVTLKMKFPPKTK